MLYAQSSPSPCPATVKLDIDGLSDTTKVNPGGLVVRNHDNNGAPRKKVILQKLDPVTATNNVILTRSSTKIAAWTAQSGGTQLTFNGTDNKFANSELPIDLWVEGVEGSDSMRDQTLTLALEDRSDCKDQVKFTVLWVTISMRNSLEVSTGNSARQFYHDNLSPPSFDLGRQLWVPDRSNPDFVDPFLVRASEFVGTISPSDFKIEEFGGTILLNRYRLGGKLWSGPNGDQLAATFPEGAEPSKDAMRDDVTAGGGPAYDIDVPGPGTNVTSTAGTIQRFRMNFRAWADYVVGTTTIRCSDNHFWFTRQSYKLVGPVETGNATGIGANTLTDSNKNWSNDMWIYGSIFASSSLTDVGRIATNSATVVTLARNWTNQPDVTAFYRIIRAAGSSSWAQQNDVTNDNVNSTGTTPLSWNLQ